MLLLASNVLRKANKGLVPCLEENMLDTQEIIPFNISPDMYTQKSSTYVKQRLYSLNIWCTGQTAWYL